MLFLFTVAVSSSMFTDEVCPLWYFTAAAMVFHRKPATFVAASESKKNFVGLSCGSGVCFQFKEYKPTELSSDALPPLSVLWIGGPLFLSSVRISNTLRGTSGLGSFCHCLPTLRKLPPFLRNRPPSYLCSFNFELF